MCLDRYQDHPNSSNSLHHKSYKKTMTLDLDMFLVDILTFNESPLGSSSQRDSLFESDLHRISQPDKHSSDQSTKSMCTHSSEDNLCTELTRKHQHRPNTFQSGRRSDLMHLLDNSYLLGKYNQTLHQLDLGLLILHSRLFLQCIYILISNSLIQLLAFPQHSTCQHHMVS